MEITDDRFVKKIFKIVETGRNSHKNTYILDFIGYRYRKQHTQTKIKTDTKANVQTQIQRGGHRCRETQHKGDSDNRESHRRDISTQTEKDTKIWV